MSNHVRTSIRAAIVYGLQTIVAGVDAGNGYTYKRSINHIASPIEDPEQFPVFDAVNIFMDEERCQNQDLGSHTQSGANRAILENSFEFTLVNWMQESNNIELAQDNKLADLQTYFGLNYIIPSSNGNATVFNCVYSRMQNFGYSGTRPLCGVEVVFRVWYRQKLEDPTSLG